MEVCTIEIVINTSYGGFHIDHEMAQWLKNNKGWTIGNKETDDLPPPSGGDHYGSLKHDFYSTEFRTNKDLIECVKALKKEHPYDPYKTFNKTHYVQCLKVAECSIKLEVYNKHDGIEDVEHYVYVS